MAKTIARYDSPHQNVDMVEVEDGDWVLYEDIKHLLRTGSTCEHGKPMTESCVECGRLEFVKAQPGA